MNIGNPHYHDGLQASSIGVLTRKQSNMFCRAQEKPKDITTVQLMQYKGGLLTRRSLPCLGVQTEEPKQLMSDLVSIR